MSGGRRDWWAGAFLYEVYLRSFRDSDGDGLGDLAGVLEKLDHIAGLGVDGLWLSPFFASPMKDFGYDIVDFRAVDPRCGTMDDLHRLLTAAHDRDLKVLIDFTPAHTSDEHPWFTESRASRDNPKADWFIWSDPAPDGGPPNNWLSSFGGGAWGWDGRRGQYYLHPFLSCQPALNLRCDAAREAVLAEMAFWFDQGVDGLRLDAVQTLSVDPDLRSNPPQGRRGDDVRVGGGPNNPFKRQMHLFDRADADAFDHLAAFRDLADRYDPPRVLIGELSDVDSAEMAPRYAAPGRLHAVYDFDVVNCKAEAPALTEKLRKRDEGVGERWLMQVFSNHDTVRGVSNLTRFAVEQGRAADAAKMLLFMQAGLRGGAILFQGEELGLTHPRLAFEEISDPWGLNLWPDFEGRDGARTPMPWRKDAPDAGFTEGGAPWLAVREEHRARAVDAQEADPDSVLAFTRAIMAWRREEPRVRWGRQRIVDDNLAPLIVWDRWDDGGALRFVVNFSLDRRMLPRERAGGRPAPRAPARALPETEAGHPLPPLGFLALTLD